MTRSTAHLDISAAVDREAQDWFLRLTSGDPEAADIEGFKAWCQADPSHLAAYREVATLWGDLEALRPEPVAVPAESVVLRPDFGRTRPMQRRFPAVRAGLAAITLIAACLLLFFTGAPGMLNRLESDYATAVGQQQTVTLPDGSLAYLNTGSAIAIDYSGTQRQIRLLEGEALFEVKKDAARPFDVLALGGRVTAVGTAFTVKVTEDRAKVTVTEGTVRVSEASQARDVGTLVSAGQTIAYRAGDVPGAAETGDPADATAWRRGQIVIRNQSLADALAEVGRYHPGKLILMAEGKKLQPVTARISIRDTAAGIDTLAATQGLSVLHVTGYLTVVR